MFRRAALVLLLALALPARVAHAWTAAPGADATADLDPDAPGSVEAAIALLCADQRDADCPLAQRIAAAEWLRVHPSEAAGPALLRVFARSRFGALAEDPDLFERALRGVQALPPDAQHRAVVEGLAPALVDLTWDRLTRRWLLPLADRTDADLIRRLQGWPRAHADELEALRAAVTADLEEASLVHGPAFVTGLSTEGGSLAEAAAYSVEDALLATLLRSEDAGIVQVAVAIVAGGPRGGLQTRSALDGALSNPDLPDAVQRAAIDPALHRWLSTPKPPIAPIFPLPGHRDGADALEGPVSAEAYITRGSPPFLSATSRWLLLAFGLVGLGVLAGLRGRGALLRSGGALLLGCGMVAGTEGGLKLIGVHGPSWTRPLVGFYHFDKPLLRTLPSARDAVVSPGGPVRHQAVSWPEPADNLRIATIGASTAHGSHYLVEEAFSSLVLDRLRARFPAQPMDGLNLAVGGALSDGVAAAGAVALEHGADVLVAALGHNESSAFTRLGQWDPAATPRLPLQLRLSSSSIYGLLARLRPDTAPSPAFPAGQPTRADHDALLDLSATSLRWNTRGLLDRARAAGVPVILVVPPTNWRFVNLEAWPDGGPGDQADLTARVERAEALSSRGDGAAARREMQAAIDVSAAPREITGPVKRALIEVAEERGATLVFADRLFDDRARDGLTASGLFWDDLHPTRQGHALIAEVVSEAIAGHPALDLQEGR